LWLLALIGVRQVVRVWATDETPPKEWADKRARFREKIREAFDVWKEPAAEAPSEEES
jgi:hypothetical protein